MKKNLVSSIWVRWPCRPKTWSWYRPDLTLTQIKNFWVQGRSGLFLQFKNCIFFFMFVFSISRAELENITNTIVTSSDDKDSVENKHILDDLHLHVKELEERRAKIQPIINLVDNMVRSPIFLSQIYWKFNIFVLFPNSLIRLISNMSGRPKGVSWVHTETQRPLNQALYSLHRQWRFWFVVIPLKRFVVILPLYRDHYKQKYSRLR